MATAPIECFEHEALFTFMDIYNDKNLVDCKWQAQLQDSVRLYNRINHTTFDPYQSFIDYIQTE